MDIKRLNEEINKLTEQPKYKVGDIIRAEIKGKRHDVICIGEISRIYLNESPITYSIWSFTGGYKYFKESEIIGYATKEDIEATEKYLARSNELQKQIEEYSTKLKQASKEWRNLDITQFL